MKRTVYHLLDEAEVFSETDGGAISRWVANVLRDGEEIVVCPSSDQSWQFASGRVYEMPYWHLTNPVHPLLYRLPWRMQRITYLTIFRLLLRKIKAGDLLYVHNRPEVASVLSSVARTYGITIVLHMHNSHLTHANRGQLKALRKTAIVFCSRFLKDEADSKLPNAFEKTYVVHNGADEKKFGRSNRPLTPSPTIIFTGRLVHYKGVHILLEAMRILESKAIKVNCKVVGTAAFGRKRETMYTRRLRKMKPYNTELVGYKSGHALADMLRSSNIFCCPSIWNDPFPLAPLEAMATGLPVVASNVGGIPEALHYGGGLLVPPNNSEMLADSLETLVRDPSLRAALGDRARTSIEEHFLWTAVRHQYEQVIQDVSRCN